MEEIKGKLKAKEIGTMVGFGSGITVTFVLDDVYFIEGEFSYEGKLEGQLTHPIAITYGVKLEGREKK